MSETEEILGVTFSTMNLTETTNYLSQHIQMNKGLFHLITINPEILMITKKDEHFKQIVNEANLITPDGIGIVMASKLKEKKIVERVTGYDLLHELLVLGNEHNWSFFFLGTDEQTNKKAVEIIQDKYRNIKIAGRHHGFFNENQEVNILKQIEMAKPQILIVAMGAPYSDKWVSKNKVALKNTCLVFGVGGSLDVISGKVKVTPAIWKKLNLEWLHRLFTSPAAKGQKSRWKRQIAIPKFIYEVIKSRLF